MEGSQYKKIKQTFQSLFFWQCDDLCLERAKLNSQHYPPSLSLHDNMLTSSTSTLHMPPLQNDAKLRRALVKRIRFWQTLLGEPWHYIITDARGNHWPKVLCRGNRAAAALEMSRQCQEINFIISGSSVGQNNSLRRALYCTSGG